MQWWEQMNINNYVIYDACIKKWGKTSQILMVIEELNELAVTLCHSLRKIKKFDRQAIINELVDVKIMLEQLQIILQVSDIDLRALKIQKLERVKNLLGVENTP